MLNFKGAYKRTYLLVLQQPEKDLPHRTSADDIDTIRCQCMNVLIYEHADADADVGTCLSRCMNISIQTLAANL